MSSGGARPWRAVGVLAVAALAALTPAKASAQAGHSLTLTGPSTATVGAATTLRAAGIVPPDVFLQRYLNVYALPESVVSSCPATYQGALQIKDNTTAQGGETVALFVPVDGSFTTPVAWTPTMSRAFLLCGYVHEGVVTMAAAGHRMAVSGSRPRIRTRPTVRRAGRRLVCARGSWSGSPTRYRHQWEVDGRRRARGGALRVTRGLRGRRVRCAVTATNAAGSTTAFSRAIRVR